MRRVQPEGGVGYRARQCPAQTGKTGRSVFHNTRSASEPGFAIGAVFLFEEARTLITTISPHRSWENTPYVT
jgi:hypothetical protein